MVDRERPEGALQPGDIAATDPQSLAFVRGLVARGEALRLSPDGELPRGATHEIIGEDLNGVPILRRRRFSTGL